MAVVNACTCFHYLLSLAVHGRLIVIGYIEGYESDKGYKPSRTLATLPARVIKHGLPGS